MARASPPCQHYAGNTDDGCRPCPVSFIEDAEETTDYRMFKAQTVLSPRDASLSHHLAEQMISIDLDYGVMVHYAKIQNMLVPIK